MLVTSQTFYSLRIPRNFIGARGSVKSVMIGSLFVLLQNALAHGNFIADTLLTQIINLDCEVPAVVRIATTRVPDFDEHVQRPAHGFRYLCSLGTVNATLQDIPEVLHPTQELLACNPQAANHIAIDFAESFQPMGVDLPSHFNLIFYPVEGRNPLPVLHSAMSTPSESSLSPSDSASAVQSRGASPQVAGLLRSSAHEPPLLQGSSLFANQLQHADDPSPSHSPTGIPIAPLPQPMHNVVPGSSHVVAPHMFSPSPSPQPPPPAPSPPATTCISLNGSTDGLATPTSPSIVRDLLVFHAIPPAQIEAAMCNRGFKRLHLKVRNFNAMRLTLQSMGFSLPFRVLADSSVKLSCASMTATVAASEVLRYFDWAPHSFEHKTGWYAGAEAVSELKWDFERFYPGEYPLRFLAQIMCRSGLP